VVVFVPPRPAPVGLLRQAEDGGRQSLAERTVDPLSPERFRAYFRDLYWKQGARLDRHGILDLLDHKQELKIRFRTAAERFRLINDVQLPVIVRFRNHMLIRRLRYAPPDRLLMRQLQRFIVGIPRHLHARLLATGEIEEWHPGIWVQAYEDRYDPEIGLLGDRPEVYEPADLIG
jgi:CRISPR-associated endonuclease/helicase Cas3